MSLLFRAVWALGVCSCMMVAHAQTHDAELNALLQQSTDLIANHQSERALEILLPFEERFAGVEAYDYWLGFAAVRAKEAPRALFALERVTLNYPYNAAARMELIAAYLAENMLESAEEEIAKLEQFDPPEKAKAAIEEFKRVIALRRQEQKKWQFQLGLDIGHDNNVSSNPDITLKIPVLNFDLPISSSASEFVSLRASATRTFNLENAHKANLTFFGMHRHNHQASAREYDLSFAQISGNYLIEQAPKTSLVLGSEVGKVWLGAGQYREHFGANILQTIPMNSAISASLEASWRRFAFESSANADYDMPALGVALHIQPTKSSYRLTGQVEFEREDTRQFRFQGDGKRMKYSLSGVYQPHSKHILFAQIRHSDTKYNRAYVAKSLYNADETDKYRRDRLNEYSLGWTWLASPNLNVSLRASKREQDSNVKFYQYDQRVLQFSSNYSF